MGATASPHRPAVPTGTNPRNCHNPSRTDRTNRGGPGHHHEFRHPSTTRPSDRLGSSPRGRSTISPSSRTAARTRWPGSSPPCSRIWWTGSRPAERSSAGTCSPANSPALPLLRSLSWLVTPASQDTAASLAGLNTHSTRSMPSAPALTVHTAITAPSRDNRAAACPLKLVHATSTPGQKRAAKDR